MTDFEEIHEAVQNCEPLTPEHALQVLIHQARHSAPSDTDMDQGYTEAATDALRLQKEINSELLKALEWAHDSYGSMMWSDRRQEIVKLISRAKYQQN